MNPDLKTIRQLIKITADYFDTKDIESSRLNAERLLADVLGLSRIELYFQHDRPLVNDELDKFRELVRRRATGEPLQTILGMTEFYSHPIKVVPGVFIPRPETERLVETAIGLLAPEDHRLLEPVAVEIGCGTGIISISLALAVQRLTVYATDINPKAIELAGINAHNLGAEARVHLALGSRFDPLPDHLRGGVDLLISNPPYVRSGDIAGLSTEVADHDPRAALDGGEDGLDFYRSLASAMGLWVRPGGWIALEIGDDQAKDVSAILATSNGTEITVIKDYAGRDRVVTARL